MAMQYFPFDNTSSTQLDRNVSSDTFAEKFLYLLSGKNNGIYAPLGNQGLVQASTGMYVTVQPCSGCIWGRIFNEETVRTLQVTASESLDRIDSVILKLDKTARTVDLYVLKGTAASSPNVPTLANSGGIVEVGIANIYIPALSTSITNQRITDTRLNTARCAIIPVVGNIDTSALYNQIQADLASFKSVEEQGFTDWFNEIKGQLTTDAAGHLQLEIGTLTSLNTTDKTDLVTAVNEVNTKVGTLSSLTTYVKTSIVNAVNWLHTKVINAIAPDYSASSTYSVGDIRFYQSTLYRCTTPIPTSEAWNASHWSSTSFSSFINIAYEVVLPSYNPTYLTLLTWDSQKYAKTVIINSRVNIPTLIPDGTNIGTTSFKPTLGATAYIKICEPSTGKCYIARIDSNGIIYAWGSIPVISNAIITGVYNSNI